MACHGMAWHALGHGMPRKSRPKQAEVHKANFKEQPEPACTIFLYSYITVLVKELILTLLCYHICILLYYHMVALLDYYIIILLSNYTNGRCFGRCRGGFVVDLGTLLDHCWLYRRSI